MFCIHLLATIRLPSDKTISPLSTKVFKIQVTFVGALSASSTTKICPNFTAFTWKRIKASQLSKNNCEKLISCVSVSSRNIPVAVIQERASEQGDQIGAEREEKEAETRKEGASVNSGYGWKRLTYAGKWRVWLRPGMLTVKHAIVHICQREAERTVE